MGPHAQDTCCTTQCNIYVQLTQSMGWAGQTRLRGRVAGCSGEPSGGGAGQSAAVWSLNAEGRIDS